jgi:uncharacterized protein (DUF1330 family)
MPKGYIVAELTIQQRPAEFIEYRDKVLATVEAFGGRFLVRGGAPSLLEGDEPVGSTVVVIEFESQAKAMEWYNSPAYQEILPKRLRNATGRVTCSTGV